MIQADRTVAAFRGLTDIHMLRKFAETFSQLQDHLYWHRDDTF